MSVKLALVAAFLFITLSIIIDAAPAQSATALDENAKDGPHVIPPVVAGGPAPQNSLNNATQPRKVLRRRPLEKSDKSISSSNSNVQTMHQLDAGKARKPEQANDYYYYYYYYY